jgi:hypothetical protein
VRGRVLGRIDRAVRVVRGVLVAAALLGATADARAALKITPVPLLGKDGVFSDGWNAFAVRVDSSETQVFRGTLEVSADGNANPLPSLAPLALPPGVSTIVQVPVHLSAAWRVRFVVRAEDGTIVATESVQSAGRNDPLLIDLHSPPRLQAVLRGVRVPTRYEGEIGRGASAPGLAIGGVWNDPVTGDPLLPQRPAEWGGATAVLLPSDLLARLGGAELDALVHHVLAGGTLAVVVRRPEDLRQGPLPALLGGEVHEGKARHLQSFATRELLREPGQDPGDSSGGGSAGSGAGKKAFAPVPSKAVVEALVGYEGGALAASDFGASAPYGLGEVHLLAFDPTRTPGLDDPWVQERVVDLVRHAWDRRAFLVFPQGGPASIERGHVNGVRKQLDPNESARWAIVVAAILLLGYSVLAGPINFALSTRAGKPLRAIAALPLLSGLAFLVLMAIGVASRGWRGEARRVSLLETAGGMTRGTIRRFRGFFTPSSRTMTIRPTSERSVLDVTADAADTPQLRVDRGGLALEKVGTLPWQTAVVREDDIAPLGGGINLVRDGDDLAISNRSAHDLRGLVAFVPGKGLYLIEELRDGQVVKASTGRFVTGTPPGGSTLAGSMLYVHPLGVSSFQRDLNVMSAGLGDAWEAFGTAAEGRQVDWWPSDTPVVLAQMDGGEGALSDGPLRLQRDRLLVRVVGFGGVR